MKRPFLRCFSLAEEDGAGGIAVDTLKTDIFNGEPNRLHRGGGSEAVIVLVSRGSSLLESRFSSVSSTPVPARPAWISLPSAV